MSSRSNASNWKAHNQSCTLKTQPRSTKVNEPVATKCARALGSHTRGAQEVKLALCSRMETGVKPVARGWCRQRSKITQNGLARHKVQDQRHTSVNSFLWSWHQTRLRDVNALILTLVTWTLLDAQGCILNLCIIFWTSCHAPGTWSSFQSSIDQLNRHVREKSVPIRTNLQFSKKSHRCGFRTNLPNVEVLRAQNLARSQEPTDSLSWLCSCGHEQYMVLPVRKQNCFRCPELQLNQFT